MLDYPAFYTGFVRKRKLKFHAGLLSYKMLSITLIDLCQFCFMSVLFMKHPTRTRVLLYCTGKHRIYLDKLCVFPSTRCDKVTQRVVSVAIAVTRHDVTTGVPTIFVSTEIVFESRFVFESGLCLNPVCVNQMYRFCFNNLWLNPKRPVYKHGFSHFTFIRSSRLLTHTQPLTFYTINQYYCYRYYHRYLSVFILSDTH